MAFWMVQRSLCVPDDMPLVENLVDALVERKVRSARVFNQIRPCRFSRVLRQDMATIGYILHLNNTNVAKNEVQSLLYYVDV